MKIISLSNLSFNTALFYVKKLHLCLRCGLPMVTVLLMLISSGASASPNCSYCANYENDVECVQQCLNRHYQANQSELRTFGDMVEEYNQTGEINSRIYKEQPRENMYSPRELRQIEASKQNEADAAFTKDQRKTIQMALNKALPWEKPLAIDGVLGPATRERIRSWELINLPGRKQGFYIPTGYLDKYTFKSLLQSAGMPVSYTHLTLPTICSV